MELSPGHDKTSPKNVLRAKKLSFINRAKLLGAVVSLPLFFLLIVLYVYLPKLPLYALNARLKDFAEFQRRLDSFDFTSDSKAKMTKFVIFQKGETNGSDWNKIHADLIWNKADNMLNVEAMKLSANEARESWILLDPVAIQKALNLHQYSISEVNPGDGVVTEIRIPGESLKNVSIEKYIRGTQIANQILMEREENCFYGLVRNLVLDKISTSGMLTGDLVFTIDHSTWDITKIEVPQPSAITVAFHGQMCEGGVAVNGEYTTALSSDTIVVKSIIPKHEFAERSSGNSVIDLLSLLWKTGHYR